MESSFNSEHHGEEFSLSWTAYVRPLFLFLIFFSIGAALVGAAHEPPLKIAGVVICVISVLAVVYRFLMLHSVKLYTDDAGVWVYSGIFPWARGTMGVMWRDLEDAVYFTGFISWVLRSYKVRVGHRFTKTSEIILPHVGRGNIAVEHINSVARELISRGVLR